MGGRDWPVLADRSIFIRTGLLPGALQTNARLDYKYAANLYICFGVAPWLLLGPLCPITSQFCGRWQPLPS